MRDITIPPTPPRPTRATMMTLAAGVLAVTAGDFVMSETGKAVGPRDVAGEAIVSLAAAIPVGSEFDTDQDGLPDEQELVLGTTIFFEDSDGDGFNDGEEVARHSDPLDELSIPASAGISASMTARGGGDLFRLVIALHEPAGEIGFAKMRIGALTPNGVVSVPVGRFLGYANIAESEGSESSRVTTIDIPIQPGFIHASQRVTFFLAAGNQLDTSFASAAKVDVSSTDGILLLKRPVSINQGQSFQGGGSIRQPIPQNTNPVFPPTWVAGAICFQRTAVVGGTGAIVLKQIVEADCLQGWDTFCASDCAGSLGDTFETVDPAALIGG